MAKKNKRTRKEKSGISRSRQASGVTRKTPIREMRAPTKVKARVTRAAVKAAPKPESHQKSSSTNRSEGIRLFKLAGRPSKEQFIAVYGERGLRMTWEQRAAAGVAAEKFQAALAEKAVSRAAAARPAPTTRRSATGSVSGA